MTLVTTPIHKSSLHGANAEILTADLWHDHGQDSWFLTETIRLGDRKIRIRIRRNAYDHQSYALVELFDGNRWNELATLPRDRMAVLACNEHGVEIVSYIRTELATAGRDAFFADADDLIRRARLVLE